ncbi:ABC transporter permease [candidate division KSB1 bacterium]|nr:ABC transporter permease [candidate division KSB1 bacterium]
MFKNYFKVAYRNLWNNKLYAVLNVFGLGVAIAFCIVAYLNHTYNYTFDAFHKNADKIFRVKTARLVNEREQRLGIVPRPLAPALAADFPVVENAVRLTTANATFRVGEKVLNETVLHADPAFFTMFDFPLKYGSTETFQDKNKLVLSDELARKYFGEENPVGKQITLRYGDGKPREFFVCAVTEKVPDNSSIQFDALAALDILLEVGSDKPNDWSDWAHVTFVQLSDPAQAATIPKQLDRYVAAHNAAAPDFPIARFYFDPLRKLALHAWSENLRSDILKKAMHPAGMISPSIIAALLLLMACFNYINTAIAFSSKRLKEIGVRKVIGGGRRQLILQFMSENLLLCVLALILALALAEIFVPAYDNLWTYFELTLDYSKNFGLVAFLAGLLLLVGIIAGAYPAFYISAYHPVTILRGKQKFSGTSWLSRILTAFQFTVSMLAVIGSLVFVQNADFLKKLDLGYEKNLVLVIPLPDSKYYQPYRDAIEKNPGIVSVAGNRNHVGRSWYTREIESAAQKAQANVMAIGADYLATMKLRLTAGRDFDQNLSTDVEQSIIVNQKLAQEFGWMDPEVSGQTVTLDSVRYTVIGVVEDFYNDGVWRPISPSLFRLVKPEEFRFLTVRVRAENLAATNEFLRREWQNVAPDVPYEGYYQDEVMAEAITVTENIKTMFIYISVLAIVISMMGLFALVSLNIARRTKEIGIRKVLGATVIHIINLVNKEFARLLIAAGLIASVCGYYAVKALIASIYAYHVGFSVAPFVLAAFAVFLIAVLTVGSQVLKVATANPVDSLRYE